MNMIKRLLLLISKYGSWSPEKAGIKSARKSQKFQDNEIIRMNKTQNNISTMHKIRLLQKIQ